MFLTTTLAAAVYTLLVIGVIIAIYRVSEAPARAPGMDIALSMLSWVPWVVAQQRQGWLGFWACLLGQFVGLQIFTILHTHLSGYKGPKIRTTLDRFVGPMRNHLGLWITIPALPVFLSIRFAEVFVYPMLRWTLGFPVIRQREWIVVSRQKFRGLVGHDLVWCLYCDWMTGVYSLGAEMLRNVESFWCPIRFYDNKKCDRCKIEFPDVKEWTPRDGSMKDVTKLLKEKYGNGERRWFGDPKRPENAPPAKEPATKE
ncbi:hypothetical protein BH09SUM1_BH09SUM1_07350 [soil metagenome]